MKLTTREKDTGPKQDLYYEQRVPNYLIIDPKNKAVDLSVWQQQGWTKQSVREPIELQIQDRCQIELAVDDLFLRIQSPLCGC